jgi:hypothetical protein
MKTARWQGLPASKVGNRWGAGARAIVVMIAFGFVPGGAPSASDPNMPPAYLRPPPVSWSTDQLVAYAAASAAIEEEVDAFVGLYASARREQEKEALIAMNADAIRAAIRKAGLTLVDFDAMDRAVQGDP